MREEYIKFLNELHQRYAEGGYIVGSGVGSGLSAKGAVMGGADFMACYSTAVYRTQGVPTVLSFLPYDNCNEITLKAFPNVKIESGDKPVLIGMGAHDPRLTTDRMVDLAEEVGADGTVNEFFIGYMKPHGVVATMEKLGLGFERELEFMKKTLARGMMTLTWTFDPVESARVASEGGTMIGLMLGADNTGMANSRDYDAVVRYATKMAEAALQENPNVLLFLHGGVVEKYEDVKYVIQRTPVHGFFTGSSGERIPVAPAIAEAVRGFREIEFVSPGTN